jgi:ABC-2 type transport system permease protein
MKVLRDTWLIFQYEAGLLVRHPVNIAITLLLKSVMGVSTYSGAYQIYVPSLLTAMGLFSGLFAGFAMLSAIRQGVIGRFRVTPLSRVGLMFGRELIFVALTCFQGVVITLVALIFGLRAPVLNVLLALALLALMVLIGVSISYALALFIPTQTALANLTNGVTEPLALLAGVLIPLSVAPLWVRDVARWNPFAWGANGMRAVFQGSLGAQVVWEACVILGALALVAVTASSRLFTREIA